MKAFEYDNKFPERLASLRGKKGVSEREMSRKIGVNEGYISSIERGIAMPSFTEFLNICEYLGVSPSGFFDYETEDPYAMADIVKDLRKLSPEQFSDISRVIKDLTKK